jgi:hypothetical protein
MLRLVIPLAALVVLAAASPPLAPDVKDKFLTLHNFLRDHANQNLPHMVWDDAVAAAASATADKCDFRHDTSNAYVDNYYAVFGPALPPQYYAHAVRFAMEFWVTQIVTTECVATCNEYDYIIGKDNTKLGCAINVCPAQGMTLLYCDYGK